MNALHRDLAEKEYGKEDHDFKGTQRRSINGMHFALAAVLAFRNLFIMRKLLLTLALTGAFLLARAGERGPLTTNAVVVGKHGTLQILTPPDWTLIRTNMQLRGNPQSVEVHSITNNDTLRITIYWDGFNGQMANPTEANMQTIVSNVATRQYLPISVEKKFTLEKLHGKAVTGTFARFTDAGWVPMLKDEHRNLATGMFRCGNLWGNFDLLTDDKNGPEFQLGIKMVESMRRAP